MSELLLLALLAFPLPCADPLVCWLAWDPSPTSTRYEVWSEGQLCAVIREAPRRVRRPVEPRPAWWPYPTLPCTLPDGQTRVYAVVACNESGCSPFSDPVEWVGQPFLCIEGGIEVRCEPGAPCRLPPARGCS